MPRKTHEPEPADGRQVAASMRPRPDAAENFSAQLLSCATWIASMRPRPDAAENRGAPTSTLDRRRRGFNEAAARCRGKPGGRGRGERRADASMRPRPDAAENVITSANVPASPSPLQ